MSKGPGSKSGIGVNHRPPGYRTVARVRVEDPLAGDTAKKRTPHVNPPVAPEPGASDKAAGPPAAVPGKKAGVT